MCRTFRCRGYFKKIIHMLTGWSKIGKQNRIKHTKHVTDKIYMRCTWSIHILHVIMIILTTWGCKQKMPDDKLGCVQTTHVCYTRYFTASQGCINYTSVSRTIILSAQVTVGRWCDTWRVTEHHSRTFFSGPTPALSLKHPACLFFWWLCVREHQCVGYLSQHLQDPISLAKWEIDTKMWLKYFPVPLKHPFGAYWDVITVSHQLACHGRANGPRADLTQLMHGSRGLWQCRDPQEGSHTWINSSGNLECDERVV